MLPKCLQNYPHMLYILFFTPSIDQDNIDKHHYELIQYWSKDMFYQFMDKDDALVTLNGITKYL